VQHKVWSLALVYCCSVLQCVAALCRALRCAAVCFTCVTQGIESCDERPHTLQHTATHCKTVQHTATQTGDRRADLCDTRHRVLRYAPPHSATHCNTLQHRKEIEELTCGTEGKESCNAWPSTLVMPAIESCNACPDIRVPPCTAAFAAVSAASSA